MLREKQFGNNLFAKLQQKKIIMVGGKGGVGKTTCASAIALRFAAEGKRTLIVTSDPTPSLSDIFETEVGSETKQIANIEKLYGLELNYKQILKMWRERFGQEVYEVISSFLPVDYDILDYLSEAPGVVDEQFMLAYLLDLFESNEYEKIVWDTAPAGQTLTLMRLETRFYDHLTDAAKLYAKIQSYLERLREITKPKSKRSPLKIIEEWKQLSLRIISILRDSEIAEFMVVTIPEGLGVYQTDRIINELRDYRINVEHIIVNNVLPKSVCDSEFLLSRYNVQAKYIQALRGKYGEQMLTFIPLLPHEVKGLDSLQKIYEFL
jgi:arsenite-transporting ATPase